MQGLYFGIEPVVDSFTPTLDGIEERSIDIAPMYDGLYSAFRRIEQRRFQAEGPGWDELKPGTVADRERMGYDGAHPILNREGSLRRSLTTKGARNAVVEPLPDGLFMGTKDPIAKYHQNGTDRMAARPLVDLTEADAEVFAGIVGEWIYGYAVSESSLGNSESFVAVSGAI